MNPKGGFVSQLCPVGCNRRADGSIGLGTDSPTPMAANRFCWLLGHQDPGVVEGTSPQSYLKNAERGNPVGVRASGSPTVREEQLSSGTGSLKKRMPAAERPGEVITRWIGPCKWRYPMRKRADVRLVDLLKTQAKIANRGAC